MLLKFYYVGVCSWRLYCVDDVFRIFIFYIKLFIYHKLINWNVIISMDQSIMSLFYWGDNFQWIKSRSGYFYY